jgi:hypothetical protein
MAGLPWRSIKADLWRAADDVRLRPSARIQVLRGPGISAVIIRPLNLDVHKALIQRGCVLPSRSARSLAMSGRPERVARKLGVLGRYSYAWLTLAFFLVSLILHWYFGWQAFQDEASQHGDVPDFSQFMTEASRDTFENWQSEFLQLLWQVVGLAYFLYLGSPSSKENDDRLEAKIDELLRMQAGDEQAQQIIDRLDDYYLRDQGHPPRFDHRR